MDEIRRYAWRFFGRVQGVGFRMACHRAATERGVSGWVRNEPDGSVAMEAEGPTGVLSELLSKIRDHTPGARVDRLEERPLAPRRTKERFDITY